MKKIILSFLIVFLLTDISVGEEKKGFEGMVFIKGGCFEMGDTFGDRPNDEKPVNEVCVDDFYLGEHEVTQGEWKQVMGNNPSEFKNCGDDCPVEEVSYDDVQKYIRRLNNKTGLNYRLPTEAEWEYAAREGGKMVRFGTGKDTIGPDEANFDASSGYKKHYSRFGVFREKTVPVKSFSKNSLGLYDMSGNVYEWVSDWYGEDYYSNSPKDNPKGPGSGEYRVLRGGSYRSLPRDLRTTSRYGYLPDELYCRCGLGFRIAHD
jgi:formylglycine-generating enzyme required for sulfatase activity